MKISKNRKLCQATKVSKLAIFKWVFFGKFISFGVFGKKSHDIMKDNYFEKIFFGKRATLIRKSSNKHLTIGHQPFSIQNWAEDLISGNTTTGRILVVFAFVCSIVSFVIYIIGKIFFKY